MSERDWRIYIKDISKSCEKILKYTENLKFEQFKTEGMVVDAVIRNLEIIGEAAKNLPEEIKAKYPEIEWKKIAGLRDILIHHYWGIDYEILWDIIKTKIPDLKNKIEKILNNNETP